MIQVDVMVSWNRKDPVLKDRTGLSLPNPIYFSNYVSSTSQPQVAVHMLGISKINHFIHLFFKFHL